ncbi:MAG: Unknown protein [uncultured Sulfurovum sp.]|uniref:Uncharacterized protein n=1 Tax=uncultured Sulfurovum sp. TaxID=269237 RepID=A0A6S6TI45_9BACT|nr:MAG: Unknown protein [uncultured Sulfurovum sp.]
MLKKETSILMRLLTICVILLMLFSAKMIYDVTNYVGQMAGSVDNMSSELIVIRKKISDMNDGVAGMNDGVVAMNAYMERDISAMSHSVQSMSSNVGEMKTEMNKGVEKLSPMGMAQSFMK